MGKGVTISISSTTTNQAITRIERALVGPEEINNVIIRNDSTQYIWVDFFKKKSDASNAFEDSLDLFLSPQ